MLSVIARVAATEAPVLITGESGTGKELVAEAVWRNSDQRDGPFVKVNLGGIPASLFESELFGLSPRDGIESASFQRGICLRGNGPGTPERRGGNPDLRRRPTRPPLL